MNRVRHIVGIALLTLTFTLPATAQSPTPGAVQRLTVITLSLQVGNTEKEARQVTYTPPPGWYVRSHRVDCTRKTGNSSYAVATVPQNWGWSSEEKVEASYRALMELATRSGQPALHARFVAEKEQMLLELRRVRATHHALVVDATVRGEGFLRAAGGLDLTVTAELVFMGTDETLERTLAQHRATLGK